MRQQITKGKNDLLVMHVLDELAKGGYIKGIAAKYNLKRTTLECILKRYRQRYGFKNMYHMLAVYIIVKERKGAGKGSLSKKLSNEDKFQLADYNEAGHQSESLRL